MSKGLESRRKPSNPKKTYNFLGRVRGLKVFMGNFTYECDFVVLEDTTSVIDHYLKEMVLGKSFVKKSRFREEGTVMFEKDNKKLTFKMPHKVERFKDIDIEDLKTEANRKCNQNHSMPNQDEKYDRKRIHVIFDKEKPESSLDIHVDDSWMTI
nr:protein kinase-like domain, concanavalin A-like lectin/glucanase domain protein [Tanacetum cinerariifolium]